MILSEVTSIVLLTYSVLGVSAAKAQDSRPSDWVEFERACISAKSPYTEPQAALAIRALKEHLNAKGVVCTTYPPNLDDPDSVSPRDRLRLIITPTSKAPPGVQHPVCDLAEERFWKAAAPAQICYLVSYATAPTVKSFDAFYIGNDFSEPGVLQQILLPPDFFERLLKATNPVEFLQTHEGLQFALAQHKIHDRSRKTGEVSPFFMTLLREEKNKTIVDLELWRIPAARVPLRLLAKTLATKEVTQEAQTTRQKIEYFADRAGDALRFAMRELLDLQTHHSAGKAPIEYQTAFDDLYWATVSYGSAKSVVIYLGFSKDLKDHDEPDLGNKVVSAVADTLNALAVEKTYFDRVNHALQHGSTADLIAAIDAK